MWTPPSPLQNLKRTLAICDPEPANSSYWDKLKSLKQTVLQSFIDRTVILRLLCDKLIQALQRLVRRRSPSVRCLSYRWSMALFFWLPMSDAPVRYQSPGKQGLRVFYSLIAATRRSAAAYQKRPPSDRRSVTFSPQASSSLAYARVWRTSAIASLPPFLSTRAGSRSARGRKTGRESFTS
jgi:hypothetical protein